MPLFSSAIIAMCMNSQGQYKQACEKALESAARQSGIYETLDTTENQLNHFVSHKAEYVIGQKGMSVMGAGAFVVRSVRDKGVAFPLPNLGLCDSVSNHISMNSYDMTLQWKF